MGAFDILLLGAGDNFVNGLLSVLSWIFAAIGGVFLLWALYLAFLMANASDGDKRRKAKERMFKGISVLLITVALVGLLQIINVNLGENPVGETGGAAVSAGFTSRLPAGGGNASQLFAEHDRTDVIGVTFRGGTAQWSAGTGFMTTRVAGAHEFVFMLADGRQGTGVWTVTA